ncbi:MAG TPA: LytTR family DNA-binding domain-containing protein [Candidatus Nitrosotalea sp.]|nr:LytTR family DNA-binding domain-containing protein [Candidatus Nitrosotalea sp.]
MSPALRELNVLVVDDEGPARDELSYLLRQSLGVGSIVESQDAGACLERLRREHFDALFVDVRMPGLDGLGLARLVQTMNPPPAVVFVSAHQSHAVEAFGLGAVDYLLKPVRLERLQVTLQRLLHSSTTSAPPSLAESGSALGLEDRLPVAGRGSILLLPLHEIRVLIADGEGVIVVTPERRYATRLGMAGLEGRLPPRTFLRVHRHYIVNLRHVSAIETFFNGTYLLKVDDVPDLTVPVSRRHARHFRTVVGF